MKIYSNAKREISSSDLELWKTPLYTRGTIVMHTTVKPCTECYDIPLQQNVHFITRENTFWYTVCFV